MEKLEPGIWYVRNSYYCAFGDHTHTHTHTHTFNDPQPYPVQSNPCPSFVCTGRYDVELKLGLTGEMLMCCVSSIAAVHRRRPCLSRGCGASVEQSAGFRHGVSVAAVVQATPEDFPVREKLLNIGCFRRLEHLHFICV